ncbi:transketolase family protein [Chelatococcus sp. GCM10030263]|uniref:transketolase family protein n=1 Tax=Chelatococcus sp. GCM10030263 TaxID=3273387 RepID=UPI00360BE5FB
MRTAFVEELMSLARTDASVMLLTGDLGYTVFEPFQAAFPDRYINCGVAEANMMGTAAGLAREGMRPFVYSFIPFAIFRALEQIRIDICYHELPVTIVGLGAGYSYGDMGATHHAVEDIAVARALPGMSVVCPGDPWEVRQATRALAAQGGPAYMRLAKRGEPLVHDLRTGPEFRLGRALVVQEGGEIAFLATSNMLATVAEAARRLEAEHGIRPTVASIHTVKPLDADYVRRLSARCRAIFTVEEHSVLGGLGGAVCEAVADVPGRCAIHRIGIPDRFVHVSGSQDYYRQQCGLTAEDIVKRTVQASIET